MSQTSSESDIQNKGREGNTRCILFFLKRSATLDSSCSCEIFWKLERLQRDEFACFDGGTSHTRGGLLLERICGKGWWHLPLLGKEGNLARAATRIVPEFGLAARALSRDGKNLPLTLVLRNAFFVVVASHSQETSLGL